MRIDRRTLLGALGASAFALPTVASVTGAGGPPRARRALKKALKFNMIGAGNTLAEKFRLARECGFDGVEMDSPNAFETDEVLAAKQESGLAIPGVVDSLHWQKTLGDPDAAVRTEGVAALETALRDCKAYGGTTVLLVPAVVNGSISYADAYTRSQHEIKKVLPLARELDVKIAFENVWNNFLLSPLEAARYVDEFESDRVGWFMDVGNIVNYGWPEQWIRILGKRILKLDVKEFSRTKRNDEGLWKGFAVELGEGECNWPEVMRALADIGFDGWASAEVRGGDAERLLDIAHRMDTIFAS